MKYENIKYFELTFINDLEEIKKQIKNTILFIYLSEKYGLTNLSEYLDGTQYGYTASAKKEGKVKLLRITDISEGKVDWDSVPYCDCDKPDKYLLIDDDILIARTGGTTGKSFIVKNVPSNIVYASYLIRLRLKRENNADFISAFLNSYTYWSQLIELKRGAAQPNVNAEKIKKIVIPKCSSDVQSKFVSYLKGDIIDPDLDVRINKALSLFDTNQSLKGQHNHQLDLLKKLRQQILQDAVQGKLVPQDPNDEPASKLLERIKAEKEKLAREKKGKKEKPLPPIKTEEIPFEIPESWVWCRLGEIGTINPRNYLKDELDVAFIPMPLISEKFGEQPDFEIRKWGAIKNGFTHFADNDVGVAKITPCFENSKACVFSNLKNGYGAGTTELHIFRSYGDLLLPDYIYSNLKTNKFLVNGERIMRGVAGQQRVPTEYLANYPIPLPPTNEQKRIYSKINHLMKLCDELEQTIQQNQKYTKELLQVALKEALEPKIN